MVPFGIVHAAARSNDVFCLSWGLPSVAERVNSQAGRIERIQFSAYSLFSRVCGPMCAKCGNSPRLNLHELKDFVITQAQIRALAVAIPLFTYS
jgi:hypothetical protein